MLALITTRSAHPLVYSQGMRFAPFCTKPVAEVRKEQREFEELGNKIDSRFKGLQKELQQFNDRLQKQNELGVQRSKGQNDFIPNVKTGKRGFNRTFKEIGKNFDNIECDYGRNFSKGDTRFGLAAGIVFGLFLYGWGGKNEKEPKTAH